MEEMNVILSGARFKLIEAQVDAQALTLCQSVMKYIDDLEAPLDKALLDSVQIVLVDSMLRKTSLEELKSLNCPKNSLNVAEALVKVRIAALKDGCHELAKLLEQPIVDCIAVYSAQFERS